MADYFSSSVIGGSALTTKTIVGTIAIPSGSGTGTIANIPAVTGQRVSITLLYAVSFAESGITVEIGGEVVGSSLTIGQSNTSADPSSGQVIIGSSTPSTQSITGGIGEAIDIIKDAGLTGTELRYAYQYLQG